MSGSMSGMILLVTDLYHPVDRLAFEFLLNGDMRHGRRGRRPVPVLLARREPDHIAGPDFLDGPTPPLGPAAAGRHDESLAERMRVPSGPRARLKGDAGSAHAARRGRIEQRINPDCARKPICRSLAGRS